MCVLFSRKKCDNIGLVFFKKYILNSKLYFQLILRIQNVNVDCTMNYNKVNIEHGKLENNIKEVQNVRSQSICYIDFDK